MAKNKSVEKDPHYDVLIHLYEKYPRLNLSEVFKLWQKSILPEEPTVSMHQVRYYITNEYKSKAEVVVADVDESDIHSTPVKNFLLKQEASLVQLGKMVNAGQQKMVEDAIETVEKGNDAPLKERYFMAKVFTDARNALLKERELGIKAHREKRETVGQFAKLAQGVMSGEFSMEDLAALQIKDQEQDESEATIREPEPATA